MATRLRDRHAARLGALPRHSKPRHERNAHRPGQYDAPTVMRWTARDVRSLATGIGYLAPSLFLFAAFVFIPLGRTIYLSLYNTRVTGQITTFNGVDHYIDLLTAQEFRTGLIATGLFAIYTVPVGIALALILAVLLNQRLRGINIFRTMMSSTIAVSAAVGALIWLLLF